MSKKKDRAVKKVSHNQTCPENAGLQNFTPEMLAEYRDDEAGALLTMISPIFKRALGSGKQIRQMNWTPEELRESLGEYFDYFAINGLKPSKSSIRLWLNVSNDRFNKWIAEPEKYGEIHDVIMMAMDVLETQYINRGEKHPTMNRFLLESSHGHRVSQNVEVTAVNRVSTRDIDDAISKLNLEEDITIIEGEEVAEMEVDE